MVLETASTIVAIFIFIGLYIYQAGILVNMYGIEFFATHFENIENWPTFWEIATKHPERIYWYFYAYAITIQMVLQANINFILFVFSMFACFLHCTNYFFKEKRK